MVLTGYQTYNCVSHFALPNKYDNEEFFSENNRPSCMTDVEREVTLSVLFRHTSGKEGGRADEREEGGRVGVTKRERKWLQE